MSIPMTWPDTVEALFEYLNGTEHAGRQIQLIEEKPVTGPHDREVGLDEVTVVVTLDDSAIGDIDRVDKFRFEVYADDRKTARDVAESIVALLTVPGGWESPSALIDDAEHRSGPASVPHPSEHVRRFDFRVWLTTRPM